MAFRFGKIIFLSAVFLHACGCCCINQITKTAAEIEQNIKINSLDIANARLNKSIEINNKIISMMDKINYVIENGILTVEYSTEKQNGILLKLKNINFQLENIKKSVSLQ